MNRMTYAALTAILISLLTGCSLTAYSGTADVAINLGDLSSRAPNPELLQWTSLTVSAPDIESVAYTAEEINRIIALNDGVLVVPVPAGVSRTFTLSADTGTVIYTGVAVEDIATGTSTEVIINMLLADVDYIVPDSLNDRLVQFDDLLGTGRVNMAMPVNVSTPTKVDIDSNGYIYSNTDGGTQIFRSPGINDDPPLWEPAAFIDTGTNTIVSFAVRRSDNTVFTLQQVNTDYAVQPYLADGTPGPLLSLYNLALDGSTNIIYSDVWDIAVLDSGLVGILGTYPSAAASYITALLDFDSAAGAAGQWAATAVDYIATSNNGYFSDAVAGLLSRPRPQLTAYGSSFYICGSAMDPFDQTSQYVQIHELPYNPDTQNLAYLGNFLEYTEASYLLFLILPSLDGSLRLGVTDSDSTSTIIEFESFLSDTPSAAPFAPASDPFNFFLG